MEKILFFLNIENYTTISLKKEPHFAGGNKDRAGKYYKNYR